MYTSSTEKGVHFLHNLVSVLQSMGVCTLNQEQPSQEIVHYLKKCHFRCAYRLVLFFQRLYPQNMRPCKKSSFFDRLKVFLNFFNRKAEIRNSRNIRTTHIRVDIPAVIAPVRKGVSTFPIFPKVKYLKYEFMPKIQIFLTSSMYF